MKNLLIILAITIGSYQLWLKYGDGGKDPLYDEPYVAVYGRDSCSVTQKMLAELRDAGIKYEYFVVDDEATADKLHSRMEAADLSTRRYNLPVVDTNGSLVVRPTLDYVISTYNAGL